MSFESQYATSYILMTNSNFGPISHRLSAIARNGLQGHPRSMIFI